MNIKTLNVSLLSFSIITALFPLNAMATKLTIEQRLELLENELSQNKQELKATQNELRMNWEYINPDFRPYKKASRKTNINQPRLLKYQRHLPSLITSKMKTVNRTRLPQRIL